MRSSCKPSSRFLMRGLYRACTGSSGGTRLYIMGVHYSSCELPATGLIRMGSFDFSMKHIHVVLDERPYEASTSLLWLAAHITRSSAEFSTVGHPL